MNLQNINDLPQEILIYLFSFLDYTDFKEASLVCNFWNVLLKDKSLWESKFITEFPYDYDKARKDSKHTWREKFISHYAYVNKDLNQREVLLRKCIRRHDIENLKLLAPTYDEIVKFKRHAKAFLFYAIQINNKEINKYLFSIIQNHITQDINPSIISITSPDRMRERKNDLFFYAIYLKQPIEENFSLNASHNLRFRDGLIPCGSDRGSGIHVAAFVGNVEYLKEQITHECMVHLSDSDEFPPLYYSIKNNQVQATKFLLKNGAKTTVTTSNRLLPRFSSFLHTAAVQGNPEIIRLLLNTDAKNNLRLLFDGETPLHLAVHFGHTEAVKIFLEHDATLLEVENERKRTPLSSAIKSKEISMVNFLLKRGANVFATANKLHLNLGWNAFKDAISDSCPIEIFEILVSAAGDLKKIDFAHLLSEAIMQNKIAYVEKILSIDPPLINSRISLGQTALHIAVKFGRYAITKYLLEKGADFTAKVDEKNQPNHNQSVLEIALKNGNNEKIINLLLQHGAKLLGHENIDTDSLPERMQARVELMLLIRHCKNDQNKTYRGSYKTFFKKIEKEKVLTTARKIKHNTFGDKETSEFNADDYEALNLTKLNNIYKKL